MEGYAYLPFVPKEPVPLLAAAGENGLFARFTSVQGLLAYPMDEIDSGSKDLAVLNK